MGDNSESHASENSSAVSDDDASSDASSYDDDPDYPLAAPRPAQPVATTARVPPIGRLPLGGISGGLSTGRPLLGLERSQASASAASAQPGLPGNFKLEALSCSSSKETSSSMARRNDALPPIPRCETPKGFVKPPKLTLTRHADESMGEETQSSAPQSIDTKHVMTVSLLSHGLALDRISAEGRLSDSSELAKTLLTRASSALGIKSEELSWFEIRPLDINSQSLADCTQVAVAVNRSGEEYCCCCCTLNITALMSYPPRLGPPCAASGCVWNVIIPSFLQGVTLSCARRVLSCRFGGPSVGQQAAGLCG